MNLESAAAIAERLILKYNLIHFARDSVKNNEIIYKELKNLKV